VAVQDLQRMTEGTLAGIWVLTRRMQNSPDGDQKVFVAKDQKVMALADMVA